VLDNEAMSSGLTPRLEKILDTEPHDPYAGRALKRAARMAAFMQVVGIIAVLGILATIAAPMPMSPQSARAWGIAGLIVVASVTSINWLFRSQVSPEAQQQALAQILSWSDRIAELEETGQALSPEERAAAVAHVRSFTVENSYPYRFRFRSHRLGEALIPNLPLSPALRAMLVKTRDLIPNFSANRIFAAGAPWLIFMYFVLWTSLFLLTWAASPEPCAVGASTCVGALQGFGMSPNIGDFVFLVLNASAANMPPDLAPRSGLAHLVFAGSFVSAIGVLAITATGLWASAKRQMELFRP
jgi:hypothetical protein